MWRTADAVHIDLRGLEPPEPMATVLADDRKRRRRYRLGRPFRSGADPALSGSRRARLEPRDRRLAMRRLRRRLHAAHGALGLAGRPAGSDRQIYCPASTRSTSPVMPRAASDSRNSTALAMSCGSASSDSAASATARPRISCRQRARHVGHHHAGRDRIDGDAFLAEFARRGLGQADQAGLGGGVIGLAEFAAHAVDRRDVDDAAEALAPPSAAPRRGSC